MLSTTAGTVTDFRAAQKRMSVAHGEGRVSIGGHVYQPADDTSKEELASGSRTIEDLSRRLIEQARDCADAYVTDYEGVKRLLDTHEGRRRTARRAEQEERRAKAAEQRRQLKGANIFIQRPQRSAMMNATRRLAPSRRLSQVTCGESASSSINGRSISMSTSTSRSCATLSAC